MKLAPVYWNKGWLRWRDVASQPYAPEGKALYSYADAEVSLDHDETGPTFGGTLAATGLKPNFAYQVKLNGKPTALGPGNDWANEQLGRAGRWWARQIRRSDRAIVKEWRSNDAEFDRWKALAFTDGEHDYVFQGYLLLDLLIADAAGAARKRLRLDSSFHVLWKTSQRQPAPNDSQPVAYTVMARAASGWYAQDTADREVALYAEWEPGRARPGECILPAGTYGVELALTEESFHEREPDSGAWATVLVSELIGFTVTRA